MVKDTRIQFRISEDFKKDILNYVFKEKGGDLSKYIISLILNDITDGLFNSYNQNCHDFIYKMNILDDKIRSIDKQIVKSEGYAKKMHLSKRENLIKERNDLIDFYKGEF